MKNPTSNHRNLRHCTGGRSKRGSAIVLVLVSMVLMAILAGSLLQLARFERIPRADSNIEVVIESVIAEILNQATDDLLDANGDFLNTLYTSSNLNTAAVTTNGGGDEPWDYPWTNTAIVGLRVPINKDGNPVTGVRGGVMDDTWLAADMPDFRASAPLGSLPISVSSDDTFNTGVGIWRKITSINGLYVRGEDFTSNLASDPNNDGIAVLREDRVDWANVVRRDMNIRTNRPFLVDADGDGIGDSRWEWAPLRQVGGTQYVMAVRIVDLSARMDLNIATGRFNTTSASLSRGDSPAEMNGQQFVSDGAVAAGTTTAIATGEWLAVLNYHLSSNATPGATTPIGSTAETRYDSNLANPPAGSRRHHWTEGASRISNRLTFNGEDPTGSTYDYRSGFFGLTDAFELLQGNGVNSANTTTVENLMPNFLRRGGQENNYALGSINGWTQRQFWENDPRKHVSAYTGSSSAAKPVAIGQDRALKIDVNEAVKTAGGRTALRNRIDTFLSTNGAALLSLYSHLTTADDLADQLTANIADYIDDDNLVTLVGNKTGFEALPYITEVYIQRPYAVTSVSAPLVDGSKDVAWDVPATNGGTGYAIEIGNPFGRYNGSTWTGRPVSMENVWLRLGTGGTAVELSTLAGMPSELAAGDVVIVSLNSGAGTDGTLDDVSQLWGTPSGNATIAAEVTGPPMPDGAVTISLHAEDQAAAGTALSWYYSACAVQVPSGTITENLPATNTTDFPSIAAGDTSFVQTNYLGIGEGLRMMTTHPQPKSSNTRGFNDFITTLTEPSLNRIDGTGAAELANITPEFSSENKTGESTAFPSIDSEQIVWPDSDRERMHWIGDILQVPLIGPDRTATGNATTMAQAFANANSGTSIDTNGMIGLYLPYQAGTTVVNNNTASTASTGRFGVYNYPHAVLLLEQLTTFNPAMDGEDGDNQSDTESITSPDEDEVFVPGRLNLNTAPYATLERLLPFPELATRQAVANAIITRRESLTQANASPGGYGMGANNIPGIAYTSALYEQLATLASGSPAGYTNISTDSADTVNLNSSRIDLNDHETALGTFVSADGIVDDREEQLMLAKWLSEVADTRSDVFAAYIVVQGYPADNFVAGADESARLIVLFSRANVEGAGDRAVEIGRYRIN